MHANASTLALLLCLGLSLGVSEGVRVKLFPYIPGTKTQLANLAITLADKYLRSEWGKARPFDNLVIDINPADDLYDIDTLKGLFTGDKPFDIVEVDTLMLPRIVDRRWALALDALPDLVDRDWLPTVPDAVRVGRRTYGVPTYICSNVVFSFESLKGVVNSETLVNHLRIRGKPAESESVLSANWKGSWTLPGAYVDAYADTHTKLPAELTSTELDEKTWDAFKPVVDACAITTKDGDVVNPGLDGTYKGNTLAQKSFAMGTAKGYVGYTEGLHDVLVEAGNLPGGNSWGVERLKRLNVIAAPLGAGDKPVMMVDALVLNSKLDKDAEKLKDAGAFAGFLASPEVRRLIAFGEDMGGGHPPRYLMQASTAFWDSKNVQNDPVFRQLWEHVARRAVAVPNTLFSNDAIRKGLSDKLLKKLRSSGDGEEKEPER